MSKPLSIKQLAMAVTTRVVEAIKSDIGVADASYQKDMLRLRFGTWIEKVTNVPIGVIDEAIATGTTIDIVIAGRDGADRKFDHLPGDLRIVKDYHNSASTTSLIDLHDRARTRTIPFDKLFTPSLFPKLAYDEVREQELVLGDNGRVKIGLASKEHYKLHDAIEKANYEAQRADYEKYQTSKRSRDRLFAKHPRCNTTDDLMRTLGVWK